MAETLTFVVPDDLDGERVDRVLATVLDVSRAEAGRLIEQGVLVEGTAVRPGRRVASGVIVVTPRPGPSESLEAEPVPFDVVFEDESVIVVDKPPGVVVHPGAGHRRGTLAAGLLHRYPELRGVGAPGRWGLVHRLDRDTSGLLVVGRTREAHESLASQLFGRDVTRTYLAMVQGTFQIPTGTIDAPIGRDPARPTRRAILDSGKPAVTHYEVLEAFPDADVSYLAVRLDTGRTHQIRVHLSAIGHSVLGDRSYATRPDPVFSPRLFLHAHRLGFTHPVTGNRIEVEAPLPQDLQDVLDEVARIAL